AEAAAHAGDFIANGTKALEHRVDEIAVLVEIGAAVVGDGVEFLGALGLRRDVTGLLEVGECRIDDAGARRVPARRLLLHELDDLVAVTPLLGDQRQREQPQVPRRQQAGSAKHGATAEALAAAEPETMVAAAPAPRGPVTIMVRSEVSHAKHCMGLLE